LPDGIGKMKSLQSCDCFSLQRSSLANIRALGELTNLTVLTLHSGKGYWETNNKLHVSTPPTQHVAREAGPRRSSRPNVPNVRISGPEWNRPN
jgi:hypothetical protein